MYVCLLSVRFLHIPKPDLGEILHTREEKVHI